LGKALNIQKKRDFTMEGSAWLLQKYDIFCKKANCVKMKCTLFYGAFHFSFIVFLIQLIMDE